MLSSSGGFAIPQLERTQSKCVQNGHLRALGSIQTPDVTSHAQHLQAGAALGSRHIKSDSYFAIVSWSEVCWLHDMLQDGLP